MTENYQSLLGQEMGKLDQEKGEGGRRNCGRKEVRIYPVREKADKIADAVRTEVMTWK